MAGVGHYLRQCSAGGGYEVVALTGPCIVADSARNISVYERVSAHVGFIAFTCVQLSCARVKHADLQHRRGPTAMGERVAAQLGVHARIILSLLLSSSASHMCRSASMLSP